MAERIEAKEKISKEIRVHLDPWKEFIVLLNALIMWKEIWYSAVVFLSVTSFYLYIWLFNCSILNIILTFCLGITTADYVLCGPFRNILPPDNWNQNKEDTYTVIIERVTYFYMAFKFYAKGFFKIRQTNTNLFHSMLISFFLCLLYMGTTSNNLFLSYFTVSVTLLLPGFKNRSKYIMENLHKYFNLMISYLLTKQ